MKDQTTILLINDTITLMVIYITNVLKAFNSITVIRNLSIAFNMTTIPMTAIYFAHFCSINKYGVE